MKIIARGRVGMKIILLEDRVGMKIICRHRQIILLEDVSA